MKRLTILIALAVICVLFTGLAAPVSTTEAAASPTVRFWPWHDKLADGWPNGWTGIDGPAMSSYIWDGEWDWSYGAPSYVLFRVGGSSLNAQQVAAGGMLLSRGYLPSDMKLPLPGDGKYAVVVLPPDVASPTGAAWRITSEELLFISVHRGEVNVQQAMSGRWTGDQALVGIMNRAWDPCNPILNAGGMSGFMQQIFGDGFTPNSQFELYVGQGPAPTTFTNNLQLTTNQDGKATFPMLATQTMVIYARDLGCGRNSNQLQIGP